MADGAVDSEDPIEVIHFVLDEFGEGAGGVERLVMAFGVGVAEAESLGAFEPDEEVGEREAVVPEAEFLFAQPFVLGVDERKFGAFEFEVDDAKGGSDLDGADAAAEAVGALEFVEGVAEVADSRVGGGGVGHRPGDVAQDGISELQDAMDRHDYYVMFDGSLTN